MSVSKLLQGCAHKGSIILVCGLMTGILLPPLAKGMQPWLPLLVGLILFANAFRIGWKTAAGSFLEIRETVITVFTLQLFLPLAIVLIVNITAVSDPLITALILMSAAASIGGSPNITQLTGHDPAPALRLLILGIALLPITALIVFFFFPVGSLETILIVSLRLLGLILISAGCGFIIRQKFLPTMSTEQTRMVDGASVLLMAILVVGLMSAFGPAFINKPDELLKAMAFAFIANFGFQIAVFYLLKSPRFNSSRVATSIVAGNRNMAIFLVALPVAVTDPIMLFIACYQIPMYLTPILLKKFYLREK